MLIGDPALSGKTSSRSRLGLKCTQTAFRILWRICLQLFVINKVECMKSVCYRWSSTVTCIMYNIIYRKYSKKVFSIIFNFVQIYFLNAIILSLFNNNKNRKCWPVLFRVVTFQTFTLSPILMYRPRLQWLLVLFYDLWFHCFWNIIVIKIFLLQKIYLFLLRDCYVHHCINTYSRLQK